MSLFPGDKISPENLTLVTTSFLLPSVHQISIYKERIIRMSSRVYNQGNPWYFTSNVILLDAQEDITMRGRIVKANNLFFILFFKEADNDITHCG